MEAPPPPEQFDLDPATTRLEVWTELINLLPEKRIVTLKRETDPARRQAMVEPDLIDEILFFGDTWFPVGVAFRFTTPQPLKRATLRRGMRGNRRISGGLDRRQL